MAIVISKCQWLTKIRDRTSRRQNNSSNRREVIQEFSKEKNEFSKNLNFGADAKL